MKKIFLLLLFVLAFLLVSNNAMACTGKSMKYTLHKGIALKNTTDHSCCRSSKLEKNNPNCGGEKCGHSKCACTSSYLGFLFFSEGCSSTITEVITFSKQKFPVFQNPLLAGYESLWFIPKIG